PVDDNDRVAPRNPLHVGSADAPAAVAPGGAEVVVDEELASPPPPRLHAPAQHAMTTASTIRRIAAP
ncbi:MAG: hypothetical protein ABWY77_02640, partial [Acidimicrobiia bacterium]